MMTIAATTYSQIRAGTAMNPKSIAKAYRKERKDRTDRKEERGEAD
jgi:hypothetical protein